MRFILQRKHIISVSSLGCMLCGRYSISRTVNQLNKERLEKESWCDICLVNLSLFSLFLYDTHIHRRVGYCNDGDFMKGSCGVVISGMRLNTVHRSERQNMVLVASENMTKKGKEQELEGNLLSDGAFILCWVEVATQATSCPSI